MLSSAVRLGAISSTELARQLGVPEAVHSKDYVFQHHMEVDYKVPDSPNKPGSAIRRELVSELYLTDGNRSAQLVAELAHRHHGDFGKRRLSLLEFASGYGCVSRHLAKRQEFDLVACDIHEEAIDFLENELGIRALLSKHDPRDFLTLRYDVIFALSFFTHMPKRSWRAWLQTLFYHLERDGILIFTTCGRTAHARSGTPKLDSDGFWFVPLSEQKDLPTEEYGSTIVTPGWVIDAIDSCPNAELVRFEADAWWDSQDVWIVRKTGSSFARSAPAERAELLAALDTMRRSTSWRLTAPLRALIRRVRG